MTSISEVTKSTACPLIIWSNYPISLAGRALSLRSAGKNGGIPLWVTSANTICIGDVVREAGTLITGPAA